MEIQNTSPYSLTPAKSNETLEESVTELNQELELNPENAAARQALYQTMQLLLRKDPFLAYQGETNIYYKVRTLAEFEFIHPKDRAMPDIFPRLEQAPAQKAINWLGWTLIGLIPAGMGTLVFAPLAMLAAIKLLLQKNSLGERRRAWVVMVSAVALWLIGLLLFFIFVLHLG